MMTVGVNVDDKDLLRVFTCGSVDDGKSTLIGRLLYESQLVYDDTLVQLTEDSKKHGTQGSDIDFALLVDGLLAEREQGITIDVAYRYFSSQKRSFILADTPGHEQYTRNMVTGASSADVALILVDASKGILTQTKRHSYLIRLLGVRQAILVINKIDLVDYDEETFVTLCDAFQTYADEIGLKETTYIPVSALRGDNLTSKSARMPWYDGPTLMSCLESIPLDSEVYEQHFRMSVQYIIRPNSEFRGVAGTVASGRLSKEDAVVVLPSGALTHVERIFCGETELQEAVAGQSVVVTFHEDVDVSRGDLLSAPEKLPQVAEHFRATIVWMSNEVMLPGRTYLIKIGSRTSTVSFEAPRYEVNVNTLEHLAARTLSLNAIGVCNATLSTPSPLERYAEVPEGGSFIVIDRFTKDTVGAGMVDYVLRRSDNIHWQTFEVNREARTKLFSHRSALIWFTGLSGAGKSTIANLLEKKLFARGMHTYILDGDNVRSGLNKDLGFTEADRVENIRRVAEVAKLMVDAGLVVLASFISPFRSERELARNLQKEGDFIEVYVDVPLAVAESRDPKGLYRKARAGELPNFTGIDSPYEPPESPEIHIQNSQGDPEEAVEIIMRALELKGIIS